MTKYRIHSAYASLILKRVLRADVNGVETQYGTLIRQINQTQAYIIWDTSEVFALDEQLPTEELCVKIELCELTK